MATRVRNKTGNPMTLPYPYNGVVPQSPGAVTLAGTPDQVIARFGDSKNSREAFEFDLVADTELNNAPVNGSEKVTRLVVVSAPAAASATAVAAALAANAASNAYPAVASPAVPRGLSVTFQASWDGGDVTVYGTDQFGTEISETFTSAPGTTVNGVKVFKTVTAATKGTVGATANTASIGVSTKLGIGLNVSLAAGVLLTDDAAEAVTVDATNDSFTPTTVPNGTHVYKLFVNL